MHVMWHSPSQYVYSPFFPFQLLIVINGKDNARYTLSLPPGPTTSSKWQYYIAGGAVSSQTSERHIQLVNADTSNIAWRLGSLQVLKGNLRNVICISVLRAPKIGAQQVTCSCIHQWKGNC